MIREFLETLMGEQHGRRESDNFTSTVAFVAKKSSSSFWTWFEAHHIDSLAVLGVTLWLTIKVIGWSLDFPGYAKQLTYSGTDVAAVLASVLTPWGITQGLLFKWYVDLKSKNGKLLS